MVKIISAKVAQPNSAKTDAMSHVKHVVFGQINGIDVQLHVLATDPLDAMRLAKHWPESSWVSMDS